MGTISIRYCKHILKQTWFKFWKMSLLKFFQFITCQYILDISAQLFSEGVFYFLRVGHIFIKSLRKLYYQKSWSKRPSVQSNHLHLHLVHKSPFKYLLFLVSHSLQTISLYHSQPCVYFLRRIWIIGGDLKVKAALRVDVSAGCLISLLGLNAEAEWEKNLSIYSKYHWHFLLFIVHFYHFIRIRKSQAFFFLKCFAQTLFFIEI